MLQPWKWLWQRCKELSVPQVQPPHNGTPSSPNYKNRPLCRPTNIAHSTYTLSPQEGRTIGWQEMTTYSKDWFGTVTSYPMHPIMYVAVHTQ